MPGTRHGGGGWWKWRNIRFSGPSRPEIARTGLQSRSKLLAHHRFYEFQSIECSENRILRIARVIHRFTAIQVSNLLRHASYHNRREESTHSTLIELGLPPQVIFKEEHMSLRTIQHFVTNIRRHGSIQASKAL